MSAGHRVKTTLTNSELDDLLDEVLANPKVKAQLAKPRKVVTSKDVPLLGSSNIGWATIYLDVHLRFRNWPYGTIPVGDRRLDVRLGLVRHETLEPILENLYGWPYSPPSHEIAQHYEERDYIAKGFDPRAVEKAFRPFIRSDESEKLPNIPTDLDLRPMLHDKKLLERTRLAQNAQKREHSAVGYVAKSVIPTQRCEICVKFVKAAYGGPGCIGVKDEIMPSGYCRRFERGSLENPKTSDDRSPDHKPQVK